MVPGVVKRSEINDENRRDLTIKYQMTIPDYQSIRHPIEFGALARSSANLHIGLLITDTEFEKNRQRNLYQDDHRSLAYLCKMVSRSATVLSLSFVVN